ncbi:MAG TPA: hypothetical protein VF532_22000 [Candidatus Angelobacter sp.]
MAGEMITRRAFERGLPQRRLNGAARNYYYERLMQVVVRHTYYPGPAFACPDFKVIPTPDSAALMQDLGLQFLVEPCGFSIVYDTARKDDLFSYLRRQARRGELPAPREEEVWTRISVVLALKNMSFINFTRICIATDPMLQNLYFSNLDAHRLGESIMLAPGKAVSDLELEKVVPPQYAVQICSPDVTCVKVRDVSHHVVMCRPRCIPRALAARQNPNIITCKDVDDFKKHCKQACTDDCLKKFPDDAVARRKCEKQCARQCEDQVCVDTIFLDFSLFPEGKYSIEQVRCDPQSGEETVVCPKEDVLYTLSCTAPLCFIDLFLTDPMPGITENGIYPVKDLFGTKPEIVEVNYELKFLARSTFWNYFIVPQPPRHLPHLSIHSESGPDFLGPCPVVLANGARAYRFLSEKAIPLRKYSKSSFQLWSNETVIEQRLPVASTQVLPRNEWVACGDLLASLQDKADGLLPCRKLRNHLCPECKGLTLTECAERIKALLRKLQDNSSSEDPVPPGRNYSDIFVYV